MMATEATSEIFAKTSTISDHELNTIEPASEDVSSTVPVINGITEKEDGKQDAEPLDSNVVSAEVSVSGGSDTEASKAEATKSAADGKGHLRTDSKIKKLPSFKPVSVNKTFLASKTSGTTTPSKLGDKTSSAATTAQAGPTTATLRPRLVAKSGSGLRDSSSRASPAANGGKPGAPDGNAVWNKNRPTPAPEPKAYTDEELQQRYGIHLATRIQRDDSGKQANWADIDDDDDDWAPDSMEWSDGTKVTLPQAEEPAPVAPAPVPSPALKENVVSEPPKSRSPAPAQAAPSPTIKSSGLGSGRTGLVLKGAAEKPTLVAKPPGPPAPVKSPWASLPPVDKVAPIPIEVPAQQSQSRFGRPDPHGFGGMPPPPAKEIAADDFSRTWREGNSNTNRELFDSKSGRYEPVNDTRRGSRNDARHPALLQRPHQDGPAEPSAAFQTHRAGGQETYGRRRNSSNVSGGSGNFIRRMSRGHDMPPPHDMLGARRGSLAALSDDPSSPSNASPVGQYQRGQQPWQTRASPALAHASPQPVPGQPIPPSAGADFQAPPVPYEDPIEEQKKIMRASRELAIKRRQEAEAKEEAEKKERLRLKLEALGPPPEKKSKKETPKEEKAVPVQIQSRTQGPPEIATDADLPNVVNLQVEDQLITSNPEEVAENRANGNHVLPSPKQGHKTTAEPQPSHNWQNSSSSGSDRFQGPWAQQPPQHSSRNVWGPPTNDRSLGNGTFNQDLNSLPDMASPNPGPIGPPGRGSGFQQRGGRDQNVSRPAPIGPPNRQSHKPTATPEQRATFAASGWGNASQIIQEDERRQREENIKAAAQRRELEAQGLIKPYEPPAVQDTWRQVTIGSDGRRSKVIASHITVRGGDNSPPVNPQEDTTTIPIFEDRPVIEEQDARTRHFDAITQTRQPEPFAAPRGSRFFPSQDVRLENRYVEETIIAPFERPGSPLPPPPTMPGHPVYGESAFPQVHLPRPAPIVKLPPPALAPIGPPKPTSFAAAVAAPVTPARQDYRAATSQDARRQEPTTAGGWQDRINTLMGRKPLSPPRTHALQVDSASKDALELPLTRFAATVSLPGSSAGDLSVDDGSVVSKPAAEECFEEQEMGSLPAVKVPTAAPVAAWNLSPAPKISGRHLGLYDVVSISPDSMRFAFNAHIINNTLTIQVKIPGQEEAKSFDMAVPPQQHLNNRRNGGGRGGARQNSSRGRGRDASSGFPSPSVPESGRGFNKGGKTSGWGRPQPAHR